MSKSKEVAEKIVNYYIEILSACPCCFSVESSKPCRKHLSEMEEARDEYKHLCGRLNKSTRYINKFFEGIK